ncbi:hypothetical protein ACWD6R_25610 [Streptomyces sp. NPDC005151]
MAGSDLGSLLGSLLGGGSRSGDAGGAGTTCPRRRRAPDGLVALLEAVRTRAGVYRSLLRAGRSASCCTRSCGSAASANSIAAARPEPART